LHRAHLRDDPASLTVRSEQQHATGKW
jgi:hypothetical protein